MKMFRILMLALISFAFVLFTGCREVKDGADELADEVTGKKKIEKKIETEKKIDSLVDEVNKKQADALKELTD